MHRSQQNQIIKLKDDLLDYHPVGGNFLRNIYVT